MQSQCRIHNIKFPLSQNHINVKTLFAEKKGLKRNTGMSGALQILSISLEGTHHRGIDDAKNIAKILNWCLNN
jgi:inhibitor of KinA sporulation pathway (predicted exonuclease)